LVVLKLPPLELTVTVPVSSKEVVVKEFPSSASDTPVLMFTELALTADCAVQVPAVIWRVSIVPVPAIFIVPVAPSKITVDAVRVWPAATSKAALTVMVYPVVVKVPAVRVRVPTVKPAVIVGSAPAPPALPALMIKVSAPVNDVPGAEPPDQFEAVAQTPLVYPVHVYVAPHAAPAQSAKIPITIVNFFIGSSIKIKAKTCPRAEKKYSFHKKSTPRRKR
jgi:hypothetical protein